MIKINKTSSNLLLEVEIPNYIKRIQLSKARRPRFYKKGDKIPKKYLKKLNVEYCFKKIKNDVVLYNLTNNLPVLSNPVAVGTPKYLNITGNGIYSGYSTPFQRNMIVNTIKSSFKEYFIGKKIDKFPIIFNIIVYDKFNDKNTGKEKKTQDLDNLTSVYSKCILDLMTKLNVIPDDNLNYVRGISYEFIESNESKIVVKCFQYELNYIESIINFFNRKFGNE